MSSEVIMEFMGFQSDSEGREYTFVVREGSTARRQFTISIAQQAFTENRVRFQDAAEVCALKLRRELTASENQPGVSHFLVTDEELEDYRKSHDRPKSRIFDRKPTTME